jgi:class 3 adenylate cyclase
VRRRCLAAWQTLCVWEVSPTQYALSRGGRVAYRMFGDGPLDVIVRHPVVPVDLLRDEPNLARFLDRLSAFSRHVWFDMRGFGASDRTSGGRWEENIVDDAVAVMDAVGFDYAAMLSLGVESGLLFAATHPERTTALVLVNAFPRARRAEDYPQGLADDVADARLTAVADAWGTGEQLRYIAPSVARDERFLAWFSRCERLGQSPSEALARYRTIYEVDLRGVLGTIQAPTLVVARRPMAVIGRYLAERISGARLVEVPGPDTLFFVGDTVAMLDSIEQFLTGRLPTPDIDRVLATVMFTDIVDSTPTLAGVGDRRWREVLEAHEALVTDELERYRGRRIKMTGDGVLATFDGPGRAIRCASAIRDAVRSLGLEIRAGLHTGEIDIVGGDVTGLAVHIAQRVQTRAQPGEVLVSSSVPPLIAGSGIHFTARGEHSLKGVPGQWQLFAVER